MTGISIAQISEFSLLLILLGMNAGKVPHEIFALTTIIGIVTFTVSALLLVHAEAVYSVLAPALTVFERRGVNERTKHA